MSTGAEDRLSNSAAAVFRTMESSETACSLSMVLKSVTVPLHDENPAFPKYSEIILFYSGDS